MRNKPTAVLLACATLVAGCAGLRAAADRKAVDAVATIGTATAKIDTRAQVIERQAVQLPASPPRAAIVEQAAAIRYDVKAANEEVKHLNLALDLQSQTVVDLKLQVARLEAQRDDLDQMYVGPALRRATVKVVAVALAGIALLGTLSVVLGVASPTGFGIVLSRVLNTNFMYPFMLIRDLILRFRGLKQGMVPVAAPPAAA